MLSLVNYANSTQDLIFIELQAEVGLENACSKYLNFTSDKLSIRDLLCRIFEVI